MCLDTFWNEVAARAHATWQLRWRYSCLNNNSGAIEKVSVVPLLHTKSQNSPLKQIEIAFSPNEDAHAHCSYNYLVGEGNQH
jgi:hypothetical protein